MIEIEKLKIGDKVVCIINSKASLKIGKEYIVEGFYNDDLGQDISVFNEKEELRFYSILRFVTKSKYRDYVIDDLDSDFSIINLCKEVSKIIEMRKDNVISYHESLERILELSENFGNVDVDDIVPSDNNLSRLDEEKMFKES